MSHPDNQSWKIRSYSRACYSGSSPSRGRIGMSGNRRGFMKMGTRQLLRRTRKRCSKSRAQMSTPSSKIGAPYNICECIHSLLPTITGSLSAHRSTAVASILPREQHVFSGLMPITLSLPPEASKGRRPSKISYMMIPTDHLPRTVNCQNSLDCHSRVIVNTSRRELALARRLACTSQSHTRANNACLTSSLICSRPGTHQSTAQS